MKTENGAPALCCEKRVYTVSEVAEMLNVCKNTVYKLVRKNVFASTRVGHDIRISKSSFDKWLENHEVKGKDDSLWQA